jgi:beta-galactosidase
VKKENISQSWQFHYAKSEDWAYLSSNSDQECIDLPHDFQIGLERNSDCIASASEGFYSGGIGYYEKDLTLDATQVSMTMLLAFDGVYRMSEVRVNGDLLKTHLGGYSPFYVDLTGRMKVGINHIHVKVNASLLPSSRWYHGAGIYRPVNLLYGPSVCLHPVNFITTKLLSESTAIITAKSRIINHGNENWQISYTVFNNDGHEVAYATQDGNGEFSETELHIQDPQPWSTNTPYLYTLQTTLDCQNSQDCAQSTFGVRTISVDSKQGLLINGQSVLLKGGCVHHDNGPLGAASYTAAELRKVQKLKENGYNSIRCSHNIPSSSFLDICDRLGMMVVDEAFDCWREGKKLNDEHLFFEDHWQQELQAMIERDYNHPSIIMWSTGNEISERSGKSDGANWSKRLAAFIRERDISRPITNALCGFFEDTAMLEMEVNSKTTAGEGKDYWALKSEGFCEPLDVVGYNYLLDRYQKDRLLYPDRVILGTESFPLQALENWRAVEQYSHVIGDFVWTAWDYLGEAGIGHSLFDRKAEGLRAYPWHLAWCGDFDLCGRKRPQSHYRDFIWNDRNTPYIGVQHPKNHGKSESVSPWGWPELYEHWSFPGYEDHPVLVTVYAGGNEAVLFLNSSLIDRKPCGITTDYRQQFELPYQPGILEVVSYENGYEIGRTQLRAASQAVQIKLEHEVVISDQGTLVYIDAVITDSAGILQPNGEYDITFTVEGGIVLATGSGNPESTSSYKSPENTSWQGRVMAIIMPLDEMELLVCTANAKTLEARTVQIPMIHNNRRKD